VARDCVFCAIAASAAPATVLAREETCLAFLDIRPASRGHALVVPVAHATLLQELPREIHASLFDLAVRVLVAQRLSGLPAAGANLLLNDGRAANQTIPHVHIHVVPRAGSDLLRVLGRLSSRALGPLLRPTPRWRLEETAALIRPHVGPRIG